MPKNTRPQYFNVPQIRFEGPRSTNPLAFRHYDPSESIDGVTLKNRMRFSIAYRSEEHTYELSHLVISYAVFCLTKKKNTPMLRVATPYFSCISSLDIVSTSS